MHTIKPLDEKKIAKLNELADPFGIDYFKKDFSFLTDAPGSASLEGYLYPDTYHIAAEQTPADIVRQMLENFDRKLTSELRTEIKKQDKKIFDNVTMASIQEKEVRSPEDKKVVAGILWKRLGRGMPLQADSTLLYPAAGAEANVPNKLIDSPYNTYIDPGLPIGPICNPGIESIEAAVYPSDSGYLFYLSAKDGNIIFS